MPYTPQDHTFVVCAYGESPYLDDSIVSILDQHSFGSVFVSTSTPNKHIADICKKYGLELVVNEGESSIARDWNFGYGSAKTSLVTIAHQDDYYERSYLEHVIEAFNENPGVGVVHTNYFEIRANRMVYSNYLLQIKRTLNRYFGRAMLSGMPDAELQALRFGNFVCCPSVTFDKSIVGDGVFDIRYRYSCDYRTWIDLASRGVPFAHIAEPLMGHRIHGESTTSARIPDGVRRKEDDEIMTNLWPSPIAGLISKIYSMGQRSNDVEV